MGTKSTLKSGEGFHLFEEVFEEGVVYLRVDRATFEAGCLDGHGSVTVRLPVATAVALGILPGTAAKPAPPSELDLPATVAAVALSSGNLVVDKASVPAVLAAVRVAEALAASHEAHPRSTSDAVWDALGGYLCAKEGEA